MLIKCMKVNSFLHEPPPNEGFECQFLLGNFRSHVITSSTWRDVIGPLNVNPSYWRSAIGESTSSPGAGTPWGDSQCHVT